MYSRTLFGGVTAVSLLAALLFGAVYAWQAVESVNEDSTVGANSFNLNYIPTGDLLGPNGTTVTVANGGIDLNTGNFPLQIDGGTVDITDLVSQAPGDGICTKADFPGSVIVSDAGPVASGDAGGAFSVDILTAATAPADCQGDQVFYTVNILVSNP